MNELSSAERPWRLAALAAILLGSLLFVLSRPPILQDQAYHDFADQRSWAGVPSLWNVASNLPFLAVGVVGLALAQRGRLVGAGLAWQLYFLGVALVAFGSGWYHWAPRDATLVWDRLPMTIGFTAMVVALLEEHLTLPAARRLLVPALALGAASVAWWAWRGDLRFYLWVQLAPLLTVLAVLTLFRGRFSHRWLLGVAFSAYVAAKLVEASDHEIFAWTGGSTGGHALKHLLAAAACCAVLEMLRRRRALPARQAP